MIQKPKRMDAHTFGGSPAAETLVISNSGDINLLHKVSVYHKFCFGFRQLMDIPDPGFRLGMLQLYKSNALKHVDGLSIPDDVKSYLRNVIVTRYKLCLRDRKWYTAKFYRDGKLMGKQSVFMWNEGEVRSEVRNHFQGHDLIDISERE